MKSSSPRPPIPVGLWVLLLPLAPLYALLVRLRISAYRRGWLRTHRLRTPLIAVGNLTVGGSGKSPFVEYLARQAALKGLKPVVLSRGYGRKYRGLVRVRLDQGSLASVEALGDEPCLLAQRNPDLAVYVGADRLAAARLAEIIDAPGLILLDDAYQHLRIARQLNVLLVDVERGLGNGRLLPLGVLREPPAALRRADVVLVSKAGQDKAAPRALQKELLRLVEALGVSVPVFCCTYRPQALWRLDGGLRLPPSALAGREISLCCGIAQPKSLVRHVEALGAQVRTLHAFGDHHPYGGATLERLNRLLGSDTADAHASETPHWITTSKDAVKLQGRLRTPQRLWVLEMEVVPEPAAAAFFFDFLQGLPLK